MPGVTHEAADVAIVGAGPAGLSAALWLGRCGRNTVVFDAGEPRNQASPALHGYLTRDGIAPLALRAAGRWEIARYPSVIFRDERVRAIRRLRKGFAVETTGGRLHARLLLLATGRMDQLPAIPDFAKFYGRGVYHCPYCDGWEHRGETLVILDPTGTATGMVELLRTWSPDLVVCTQGKAPRAGLRRLGVRVVREKIVGLRGDRRGKLAAVAFADRRVLPCGALFFCSDCAQKSRLPADLGCRFEAEGSVRCDGHAATGVPGLFVAGNVRGGVHLAIVAAAEGAEAAMAMNELLLDEPRRQRRGRGEKTHRVRRA